MLGLAEYRGRYLRLLSAPDAQRVEEMSRLELAAGGDGYTWDELESGVRREDLELDEEEIDDLLSGPSCRVCACTEEHACDGGCAWVPDPAGGDLCSTCAQTAWDVARAQAQGLHVEPEDLAVYQACLNLDAPEPRNDSPALAGRLSGVA